MRNFLVEAEASKPTICQVPRNILDQATLTRDSVQVTNQENPEQNLWVNRWMTRVAVTCLQGLAPEREIDVAINQP
jgi:hypothetical protein